MPSTVTPRPPSAWLAGRVDQARTAADLARGAAEEPLLAADAAQLRARIEWNTGSTLLAHRMLLEAEAAVAGADPARARRLAMFAAAVSTVGGRSRVDVDPRQFATVLPEDDPAQVAESRFWLVKSWRSRQDSNLRSRLRRAGSYGIILPGQDGFLPY
jgi:hypothetical protein